MCLKNDTHCSRFILFCYGLMLVNIIDILQTYSKWTGLSNDCPSVIDETLRKSHISTGNYDMPKSKHYGSIMCP